MDPSMSLPSLFTPGLVAVAVIFPVLSTAAVALRFYVHQTGSISLLHTDDWIAFLALVRKPLLALRKICLTPEIDLLLGTFN